MDSLIELGVKRGLFRLNGKRIEYLQQHKVYDFTSEEQMRAL
jgi:hypothetical protein